MRNDFIDEARGMTPQRKQHIQDHRKKADLYGKNLPFEIGKPKKSRPNTTMVICPECGRYIWVNKTTCVVECISCKKLVSVAENKKEE